MKIHVQRFGHVWAVIGDASCYDWAHVPKLPCSALDLKRHAHSRASDAFIEEAARVTEIWRTNDANG